MGVTDITHRLVAAKRRACLHHVAPAALAMVLCVSVVHGQSTIDSGRAAPAPRAAMRTADSSGSLVGRVVQSDAAPVAAAIVTVFGASDSARTTTDGHFELHRLPFGARMVTVRRVGFALKRFASTIAPGVAPDLTITLTRVVPVLPTVTTTAAERAAYHSVGFDQRMRAGIGQFLTYDQIVTKDPRKFTDLLQGMRGIRVFPDPGMGVGSRVEGTRGPGSCVTYSIDGVQQGQITISTGGGAAVESPDELISPSEIGAVEVYTTSERPPGLGGMGNNPEVVLQPDKGGVASLSSGSNIPGGSGGMTSGGGGGGQSGTIVLNQRCILVVVWTRSRLGLVGSQQTPRGRAAQSAIGQAATTRAVTTFALDSSCSPPHPHDTTDLLVYATVLGTRPDAMSDKAWADYEYRALVAIDRWAELPSELFLPSFSLAVSPPGGGSVAEVTPALSTVAAFYSTRVALSQASGLRHRHSPTVLTRRSSPWSSRRRQRVHFPTCRRA